jgi:hypothetical protein
MGKRRNKRWLYLLLILSLLAVGVFIFLNKKKKISFSLAAQIPETTWIARVNILRALNQKVPKVKKDSSRKSLNLRKWDKLLAKPLKLGINMLSAPWLYGNDSSINILMHLSDTHAFNTWLQTDVGRIKDVTLQENTYYTSATVSKDHIVFAWNAEGKLLITLSKHKDLETEARRYFMNESPRANDQLVETGNSFIRVRLFKDHIPKSFERLKSWLTAEYYDINMKKSGLVVNSPLTDTRAYSIIDVHIQKPEITQREFWTNEDVHDFLGQRLGVTKSGNDSIQSLNFRYLGLDTMLNEHIAYEFGEFFDKIEVRNTTINYKPKWEFEMLCSNPSIFANIAKSGSVGEGVLAFNFEHHDGLIRCYNTKKFGESYSSANKDFNHIYLKWSSIINQKNNLPMPLPIKGYDFIDELTYQSSGNEFFLEVKLVK